MGIVPEWTHGRAPLNASATHRHLPEDPVTDTSAIKRDAYAGPSCPRPACPGPAEASFAPDSSETARKLEALEALLCDLAPVALGFSGGVDSTFLAAVCAQAIPQKTLLVHLDSPFMGTPECASHDELARAFGLPAASLAFDPFADESIVANGPDRCYLCKRAGFTRITEAARAWAAEQDFDPNAVCVLDGSNADDAAATDRPGTRALRELGVLSPLMEAGWTKAEERDMLRTWGYGVWNLPAGACLATRVVTGEHLTPQKVAAARACEDYLHTLGCTQVRARIAGGELHIEGSPEDLARICTPDGDTPATSNQARTEEPPTVRAPASGAAADESTSKVQLSRSVLTQLSALAKANGIARVAPEAHLYRRGSMNR